MKEIIIRMNLAFDYDDEEDFTPEPSQKLVNATVKELRIWLHNQGMEGGMEVVVEDDMHIGVLKVMQPDDWTDADVRSFCGRCSEFMRTLLQSDWVDQFNE
jgi:hypothetical protein